jgi:hypothetical protein
VKRLFLIAVLVVLCCVGQSQDLSGFWKGSLNMPSSCFPVNNMELQLTIKGDSVWGNSYHYMDVNYYVKKSLSGIYFSGTKKLTLNEGIVTTFKIPEHCKVCIKNFELTYSRRGKEEFLTGTWDGKIMGTNLACGTNTIVLSRVAESAFKEIPEVEVDTGELRLDFYDNAQVDGDSISVLVNKKLVLSHQKLGIKPISVIVKIDLKNTFQEVEMVAENLGSIPPNTAILIVTAGDMRYRLFLSSTETKSAAVRFVYVPPEVRRRPVSDDR